MTWNVHQVGDLVRISAAFEDINGVAADPTTVSLKVKDPSGNIDAYTYSGGTVSKDSTGNYHKDVAVDEAGDWYCIWESTGSAQGGEQTQFSVEPNQFT